MKPVLINFMRRLDKTLTKIHKNQRIYVSTDWGSVATLLKGLYRAVWKYPYVIVNMQTFKSLMTTCQYLVIGIKDFFKCNLFLLSLMSSSICRLFMWLQ